MIEWIIAEGDSIPSHAAKYLKLTPCTVHSWWDSQEGGLNAGSAGTSHQRLAEGGSKGIILEYDEETFESVLFLQNSMVWVKILEWKLLKERGSKTSLECISNQRGFLKMLRKILILRCRK